VKLPAILGGFAERGYNAAITVTADRPYDFAPAGGGHVYGNGYQVVPLGQLVEVEVALDGETVAYRPCFALRVEDAARNVSIGEPLCLDATVPTTKKGGEPTAPEAAAPAMSGGCSVAGTRDPGWGWLAVAALGALAALRRRRWSR